MKTFGDEKYKKKSTRTTFEKNKVTTDKERKYYNINIYDNNIMFRWRNVKHVQFIII